VRPDLAILVVPEGVVCAAGAGVEGLVQFGFGCPMVVVLPEALAPRALDFLKAGASEFVLPPVRPADLVPRVLRWLRSLPPDEQLVAHLLRVAGTRQMVGRSPAFLAQLNQLPRIAGCDATVLISGETGTGKEMCARAIHYLSRRAEGPFVAVDCGAIPADLIENELFGHERGAFTTAVTAQRGVIEEASGGSLFLDEIDALPGVLQVKLLRLLQEKEYRPLGSSRPRRADVRILAATNVDLEEAVRAGRFRRDLYYRLNVLALSLPPLRERPDDIPLLARHFLQAHAEEYGRAALGFSEGALTRLVSHAWPGNARELENVVQRALLQSDSPMIQAQDLALPEAVLPPLADSFRARKARVIDQFEREYLTALLAAHAGNVSAAAKTAKKDRRALWELLRKHHLLPRQAAGRERLAAVPPA
jgi:DNA-binding NtrC family response regulator